MTSKQNAKKSDPIHSLIYNQSKLASIQNPRTLQIIICNFGLKTPSLTFERHEYISQTSSQQHKRYTRSVNCRGFVAPVMDLSCLILFYDVVMIKNQVT